MAETAVPQMPIPGMPIEREPIDPTIDLEDEIERLKKERNAIILAHYYQDSEIQDLADFVGDSLGLSQQAASTDADVRRGSTMMTSERMGFLSAFGSCVYLERNRPVW